MNRRKLFSLLPAAPFVVVAAVARAGKETPPDLPHGTSDKFIELNDWNNLIDRINALSKDGTKMPD